MTRRTYNMSDLWYVGLTTRATERQIRAPGQRRHGPSHIEQSRAHNPIYYVDNVDCGPCRAPAGPCRAPKSRRAPGILPPLPPLSAGLLTTSNRLDHYSSNELWFHRAWLETAWRSQPDEFRLHWIQTQSTRNHPTFQLIEAVRKSQINVPACSVSACLII